jgi:hypothetical protein
VWSRRRRDHWRPLRPDRPGEHQVVPEISEEQAVDVREDVSGPTLLQDDLVDPRTVRVLKKDGYWIGLSDELAGGSTGDTLPELLAEIEFVKRSGAGLPGLAAR